MALFSSGGKLLTADAGKLASSSGCCCTEPPDPDRIVKCCFGGVCADLTAAECAFIGGESVASCAECVAPPPLEVTSSCVGCCNANEIDALVTVSSDDAGCSGIIGTGCAASRFFGRVGFGISAKAQITLIKLVDCNYAFQGCFPLGSIGNITSLSLRVAFGVAGPRGPRVPPFQTCSASNRCVCEVGLISCGIGFQTCGLPQNQRTDLCTTPSYGGSCGAGAPIGAQSGSQRMSGVCVGSLSHTSIDTILWAGFRSGCFTTLSGLKVTGVPIQRNVGVQECVTPNQSFDVLDEEGYTRTVRVNVQLL